MVKQQRWFHALAQLSLFCYEISVPWTVETLNHLVDAEIEALPADMRARLVRYSALIASAGLRNLPAGTALHLEGRLWELRLTGRDGISRALYVTAQAQRVVIVRVFVKKTQKTPQSELEIARQRGKDVK